MKKYFFIFIAVFYLITSLEAALPPLYQQIKELTSIFSDRQISSYIDSAENIVAIEKKEQGYLIITNKQQVFAEIVYEPSKLMGPIPFHIVFHSQKK